jgi:Fic family protein
MITPVDKRRSLPPKTRTGTRPPKAGALDPSVPEGRPNLLGPPPSPPPEVLRIGRGLLPAPERVQDRWIWQHPDWPQFTQNWEQLVEPLGNARQALGRLQMASLVLDPQSALGVLAEVLALEGVSSSAIEGERINPASMAASMARHLGLPVDPTAPIDRHAEGIAAVLMDAMTHRDVPLSVDRLCRWHRALFPESQPGLAIGMLRPGSVHVGSNLSEQESIVHFVAMPRERLEPELDRFITWFNDSRGTLDGLVRAGLTHLWFVTLHPFDDGNGRISRALTDLALAQEPTAAPLARMSKRILQVRPEYYAALEQAQAFQHGLEVTPWLRWFLEQAAQACAQSERIVQAALAKGIFWARHAQDQISERQRKALNRLLDAGPGGFQGGMTTRKYAALSHCSPVTASRDLTELAEWACLRSYGAGRSTAYELPWDTLLLGHWGPPGRGAGSPPPSEDVPSRP